MTPVEKLLNFWTKLANALAHITTLSSEQPYLVQLIAALVTDRFNLALDKDDKLEPVFLPGDVDTILDSDAWRQFSQPYFQRLLTTLERLHPGSVDLLRLIAQSPKASAPPHSNANWPANSAGPPRNGC